MSKGYYKDELGFNPVNDAERKALQQYTAGIFYVCRTQDWIRTDEANNVLHLRYKAISQSRSSSLVEFRCPDQLFSRRRKKSI